MFIRVKTSNKGATKYVQIVQSIRKGERVTQKIVRHMGVAYDEDKLTQLKQLAESIKIKLEAGSQQFLFKPEEVVNLKRSKEKYSDSDYQVNLKNLVEEQRLISGIHEAYGRLFDDLGYRNIILNPARHQMAVRIFSDIVLARVANPVSKRASVEMLEEDFGVTLDLDKVYRMMDRLDDKTIDRLKKITYQNTLNLFGGKIEVIFYDATTIYFESFTSDELKKCGYSKDNKSNQPQVLLALMVTKEGLPVDYQVFAGDTYEGHTLMPALAEIRKKYDIGRVVFVADSAMLSQDNISELESLEEEGFEYIVGARLKNVGSKLKEEILDHDNYQEITPGYKIAHFTYKGKKLVVSYSAKRALKDADDRRKALEKLKKKLKKSSSPKEYLFNSGYRKYLKVEGKSNLYLNEEKIAASTKWDGLHGVITNANLSGEEILARYNDLWTVEDAFRVTKHDLAVRPVFHWKPRRIKAHMAICFAAYSLVKHMQHRVRLQYKNLSTEKIRQTLIRVQTSILFDKQKRIRYGLPSKMSKEARKIYSIFNIKRSMIPYIIEKCKM
jgi:transposase